MKKFLKSPWTIGISTTLLGFILTIGYDLIKGKQVFTTIGKFFSMLWRWIITFLTLDLKVWWVLLGIAVLFFVLYAVAKISEPKEQVKPAFTNYTQDRFRLWKWSWNWEWSSYHKQWHVANLHAHCPQCDTPMNHDQYEDVFQCPRCHFRAEYDNHEKSYEVETVIIDNLNRQKGGCKNET